MIQSMTGYGKTVVQLPNKKITLELKSLNSKNLDLNARIPSLYREKELLMRNRIAKVLKRGKIDFGLYVEINGEETSTEVNAAVVQQYMEQLRNVSETLGEASQVDLLQMAIRMPDALKTEREQIDESEFDSILKALEDALDAIVKFRADEGKVLEDDFRLRIQNIEARLEEVVQLDPERIENVRTRIDKAVSDIKERVDENRFEQELIYYLEKLDITEEKVRLANHLSYFLKTLDAKESNGKKLGFITQEIGREINTIGSKANFAPMQQVVVQMKDELEKIKEQLLNVL